MQGQRLKKQKVRKILVYMYNKCFNGFKFLVILNYFNNVTFYEDHFQRLAPQTLIYNIFSSLISSFCCVFY